MRKIESLKDFDTKIFADGANIDGIFEMYEKEWVSGLTTNPTLMKKSGVKNYREFAGEVLKVVQKKPISFEVFSDDFQEMKRQALEIAEWGDNVFVKIPITNTRGASSGDLIESLSTSGVKLNVTAIMTTDQVKLALSRLSHDIENFVSVFAGRIADTGQDPLNLMKNCLEVIGETSKNKLIWASPREFLNLVQANSIGCHIITMSNDLLAKAKLLNKDLSEYSLETVKMFYEDAKSAGYEL